MSISPLDDRYKNLLYECEKYFSEYALMKRRIDFEVLFLKRFLREIGIRNKVEIKFSEKEFKYLKRIEKKTRHDIKAVEFFLRKNLERSGLEHLVHIFLTSEDVNSIAYACNVRDFVENIYIKYLRNLIDIIIQIANKYKNNSIVAFTHAKPAVPTTFGKEIVVFAYRLINYYTKLKKIKLTAKVSGAVGSLNSFSLFFKKYEDVKNFLEDIFEEINKGHFIRIERSIACKQTDNNDLLIELLSIVSHVNRIIENLCTDVWLYILTGILDIKNNGYGSSTMPQKVNPREFENAEGNARFSNYILNAIIESISKTRLQRDLSSSTVIRNIGVAFSHSIISIKNLISGLKKIELKNDCRLLKHYEVLSEAVQTYLRLKGYKNAYEIVKTYTWGISSMRKDEYIDAINKMKIREEEKKFLSSLEPYKYIGFSKQIVKEVDSIWKRVK